MLVRTWRKNAVFLENYIEVFKNTKKRITIRPKN
jgi:hypothetical protein